MAIGEVGITTVPTELIAAGVGERADAHADARIILEGIRNTTTQTRTSEANYVVWQKMVNQGTREETSVLPSFTGPRVPSIRAPGGITVQIADGEFKSQIATLSQQPGMGYLNDMTQRKDVNWQRVELAHWAYSARVKILVATIFSIALIGCSSIQTLNVRELFASECGVFDVLPIERRVIKVPTVKWEAREDVGDYCKRISGGRTQLTPLACAVWEPDKSRCTIITSPVTTHTILGHELRHCFEGDFHK